MERFLREIAGVEREILTGKSDLPGLCLALRDWSDGIANHSRRATPPDAFRAEGNISKLTGHRGVIVYEEFRTCDQ